MINIDTRLLPKIDEREMWLLIHLVKRIGLNGTCWPSNSTLCKDTGWHIEKVQKVKNSLIDKGLLKSSVRKNTSNVYKIMTDYLGVFISADTVEMEDTGKSEGGGFSDIPPTGFSDIPPTGKSSNKVLSNEVLFKEVLTNIPFDSFWSKYDKKKGRPKSEQYWKALDNATKEKIMVHLNDYVKIEKQYRKDPERYLKNRCWEDEVVLNQGSKFEKTRQTGFVQ